MMRVRCWHKLPLQVTQQRFFTHNTQHSLVIHAPASSHQGMGHTSIAIACKLQNDVLNRVLSSCIIFLSPTCYHARCEIVLSTYLRWAFLPAGELANNQQFKLSAMWSASHVASPCSDLAVVYSMGWEMLTLAVEWSVGCSPTYYWIAFYGPFEYRGENVGLRGM